MKNNFMTALQDALADPASYASFKKEQSDKVYQRLIGKFSGKFYFAAVILPKDIGSDVADRATAAIRVRPLDLEGFILPEPCEPTACSKAKKTILALHPIAYPAQAVPATQLPSLSAGQRVLCSFEGQGPAGQGQQRGLVYYPQSIGNSVITFDCLNSRPSTHGRRGTRNRNQASQGRVRPEYEGLSPAEINQQEIKTLPTDVDGDGAIDYPAGGIRENPGAQGGVIPDWEELKKFANDITFKEIRKIISEVESSGDYDIFNLSPSGGGTLGEEDRKVTFERIFGKKLSDLTLLTILNEVQTKDVFLNKDGNPAHALAVGKYQIVPTTMRSIVEAIPKINLDDRFASDVQETLGFYLYIYRRKEVGNYIIGRSNDLKAANIAMCQEWAGLRCNYHVTRPASTKPKWPELKIKPGMSYYAGVGTNPPIDDFDLKKARKLDKKLKLQKQFVFIKWNNLRHGGKTNDAFYRSIMKFEPTGLLKD